jgi:hypothetical protein
LGKNDFFFTTGVRPRWSITLLHNFVTLRKKEKYQEKKKKNVSQHNPDAKVV